MEVKDVKGFKRDVGFVVIGSGIEDGMQYAR